MTACPVLQINLNIALAEERSKRKSNQALSVPTTSKSEDKDKEIPSLIKEMETKHGTVYIQISNVFREQKLSINFYTCARGLIRFISAAIISMFTTVYHELIDSEFLLFNATSLYSFAFTLFSSFLCLKRWQIVISGVVAAATVAELEDMIRSQNQLMDKLSGECHALTQKLEDASSRHK